MKNKLLVWGLAMIAMLWATSCNESKTGNLLDKVPANSELVMVGNLRTIIESAGGEIQDSKIKLPSSITDFMGSKEAYQLDEVNDFLKSSTVNVDACALVINKLENDRPIIIFTIGDQKKFVSAVEDEGFREKDDDGDLTIYAKKTYESTYNSDYDDYSYIGVQGSYGYLIMDVWVGSEFKPARAIKRLIEAAKEESYASTAFGKYISEGNAGGLAVRIPKELKRELRGAGMPSAFSEILDGVVCIKFDLDKNKAKAEMRMLAADGKQFDTKELAEYMDSNAKIDKKALAYMGNNEQLVYAVALNNVNWSKYINAINNSGQLSRSDANMLEQVESYLKKIDGTVAIGVGVTNGLESLINISLGNEVFNNLSCTMVVSTKPDKAQSILRDIKNLLDDNRVPYENKSNGITIDVGEVKAYIQADDNYVIVSTHLISKTVNNETVDELDFTDYIAAMGIVLNHGSKIMKDLDLNYDVEAAIYADAKDVKSVMEVEIDGAGPDGFLARVISIATQIYDNRRQLEKRYDEIRDRVYSRYNSYSYDYDDYYDYDYDVDSVEVVEEAVEIAE